MLLTALFDARCLYNARLFLKCYSSKKVIALSTHHEVVLTWYLFHNWDDGGNADKVSCSSVCACLVWLEANEVSFSDE